MLGNQPLTKIISELSDQIAIAGGCGVSLTALVFEHMPVTATLLADFAISLRKGIAVRNAQGRISPRRIVCAAELMRQKGLKHTNVLAFLIGIENLSDKFEVDEQGVSFVVCHMCFFSKSITVSYLQYSKAYQKNCQKLNLRKRPRVGTGNVSTRPLASHKALIINGLRGGAA